MVTDNSFFGLSQLFVYVTFADISYPVAWFLSLVFIVIQKALFTLNTAVGNPIVEIHILTEIAFFGRTNHISFFSR